MIEINIKTNGKEVLDDIKEDQPTLQETALMVLRLEQTKQYLLSIEFKSKWEIREGSFQEDEDDL